DLPRSAPLRLALSSRAWARSAPERSAAARLASAKLAKRRTASRSKANLRLIGPPRAGPSCRSLWPRARPVKFGIAEGYLSRHAFHASGPQRKMPTCEDTAENATHRT